MTICRSPHLEPDFRVHERLSHKPRPLYGFDKRHFGRPRESRPATQSGSTATEMIRSRIATLSRMHKKSRAHMVCATASRECGSAGTASGARGLARCGPHLVCVAFIGDQCGFRERTIADGLMWSENFGTAQPTAGDQRFRPEHPRAVVLNKAQYLAREPMHLRSS